jgi:[glutamine synthetase] adenylyltransferase / [glutamine synthetase]-adenylyl-L-tyrosine phosphorylase
MASPSVKDLLLASTLTQHQVAELLRQYGFKSVKSADNNLQAMGDEPLARAVLADIVEPLLALVAESADPDAALNHLERFAAASGNKFHLFSYLRERPRLLELVAKTFGASPFLAETLIRSPHYLYWVTEPQVLDHRRSKREMHSELSHSLRSLTTDHAKLDLLRIFRRKEILHIGIRDLLRLSTVEGTNSALSHLAEVLISAACDVACSAAKREFGVAWHQDESGAAVRTGFSVIALGKLGGGELNFSSDVDLMYVYASEQGRVLMGRTETGLEPAQYFEQIARTITGALAEVTNEGFVYRVDLRLRPEGRMGKVAHSLKEIQTYFDTRAEPWERLAMIKAWPVAGDPATGRALREIASAFAYGQPFDHKAIDQIKSIKGRIDRKVAAQQQQRRNVKLGIGGIREIELIVQTLQASTGQNLALHQRSTLKALEAASKAGRVSKEEYGVLRDAYVFLRDVENKLQMVQDFQTHSIPTESEELKACAGRLGYRDTEERTALDALISDHQMHTASVNQLFREFFDSSSGRFFRK